MFKLEKGKISVSPFGEGFGRMVEVGGRGWGRGLFRKVYSFASIVIFVASICRTVRSGRKLGG